MTILPRLLSQPTELLLRRAFTTRALPFFEFYYNLYKFFEGDAPAPEDGFLDTYRNVTRVLYPLLATEESKNTLTDSGTLIKQYLHRLDQGHVDDLLGRHLALQFSILIPAISKDRDIFLAGRKINSMGWMFYRVMNEREEKFDRLKTDDPEAHKNIQEGRARLQEMDRAIADTVRSTGLVPETQKLLDRVVTIGVDPKTQERFVFPPEGDLHTVEDYVKIRSQYLRGQARMERVFPVNLDDMRSVSPEEIDGLAEGPVQYVSITDDKAKQNPVTRVYPVRLVAGSQVIVDGRFKGFYLDDVVNAAGRMIEGVAYDYDPKIGMPTKLEVKNADGSVNIKVTREPYVTLNSKGELYLRLPGSGQFTQLRNKFAIAAKRVPSVVYEEGSVKRGYVFDPKDFGFIRETLGGCAISTAAMQFIRKYFMDLAKHELATQDKNLENYTTERIGGFRPGRQLFGKQKKALAWLESQGGKGVIALDAGTGKTSFATAYILKMLRDGKLGQSGKVLWVCPKNLVGNLPKEIHAFVEDADALIDRVDCMSYEKFKVAMTADPKFGDKYIAVFFDEAHKLNNSNTGAGKQVLQMNHPHKIALTASPMEKSPMDAFCLMAITNNIDLTTKEGKAQQKAFKDRFCVEVGGKITGMKTDPTTARDLRVWIKQNLFFADKRDVEEVVLPRLKKETTVLTMPPAVERAYRQIASGIQKDLTDLVLLYRDRKTKGMPPDIEARKRKLTKQLNMLNMISLMPDAIMNPDGSPVIPGAGNPKLDQAQQILEEKIGSGSRTILFTDSPKMASHTVKSLSERIPGKIHGVGLANAVELWQDGALIQKYKPQVYVAPDGSKYKKEDWSVFIMEFVVKPNPEIVSLTLTEKYCEGQNLQTFDTVIHLDRDTWNSERMKQRTARAWRTGATHGSVSEHTLDMVYGDTKLTGGPADLSLDQIRESLQKLDGELFDAVVVESQTEALGKEFFDMKKKDASFFELNRRMLKVQLSPYLARIGREE